MGQEVEPPCESRGRYMNRAEQKTESTAIKTGMMRERIDRLPLRREKIRGHPTLLAALLAVAVYFGVRAFGVEDHPAQLRFIESPSDRTGESTSPAGQLSKPVFSGEAYYTVQRLRECGALLMAVSLSAFEEFQKRGRFPATFDVISADLQKRSLLPPGIEIRDGVVRSASSELRLNYQPDPFMFEIFSFPTNSSQSSAILFRFPLPPGETNSIIYFESGSGTESRFPAQFSTVEQLSAAGWGIRHWRGERLALDEFAVRDLLEQDSWLRSVKKGSN